MTTNKKTRFSRLRLLSQRGLAYFGLFEQEGEEVYTHYSSAQKTSDLELNTIKSVNESASTDFDDIQTNSDAKAVSLQSYIDIKKKKIKKKIPVKFAKDKKSILQLTLLIVVFSLSIFAFLVFFGNQDYQKFLANCKIRIENIQPTTQLTSEFCELNSLDIIALNFSQNSIKNKREILRSEEYKYNSQEEIERNLFSEYKKNKEIAEVLYDFNYQVANENDFKVATGAVGSNNIKILEEENEAIKTAIKDYLKDLEVKVSRWQKSEGNNQESLLKSAELAAEQGLSFVSGSGEININSIDEAKKIKKLEKKINQDLQE